MKLRIGSLLLLLFITIRAGAYDFTYQNLGEYFALAEGNALINSAVTGSTSNQTEQGVIHNGVAYQFSNVHTWEKKYNQYLSNVSGFASALKAGMSIYDGTLRTVLNLVRIAKAAEANPQGPFATLSMNNLYADAVTEFISVYKLMKFAIAHGGDTDLLNGKERCELMWTVSDKINELSATLTKLYFSIRIYNIADAWYQITSGIYERDKEEIARHCLNQWQRAGTAYDNYNI